MGEAKPISNNMNRHGRNKKVLGGGCNPLCMNGRRIGKQSLPHETRFPIRDPKAHVVL